MHTGVEQGRRGTQDVLGPARHLVRECDRHVAEQMRRILRIEYALYFALVGWLARRAGQRHHQCARAPAEQSASRLHHLLGPRFRHNSASRIDLFVDGGNQVGLDQRRRVGRRAEIVREAAASNEAEPGAPALHEGIGGESSAEANHVAATEQAAQVGKAHPFGTLAQARKKPNREIVRCRLHLGQPVALAIGKIAIGESAAGVDVRGETHHRKTSLTKSARRAW